MNTNTPSTTIICGVQGAGKSHSVSVIIENSLIPSMELGRLAQPLSVVVFHLGAAQGGMHLPCESSFLRKANTGDTTYEIPINVLVSPSNLAAMRKVYADTGATVSPFYLSTKDLNCTRMFSLMHVTEDGKVPLYIQVVQQILRSMGNENFSYKLFKRNLALKESEFSPQQKGPLNLRIDLLESILLECQTKRVGTSGSIKQYFKQGVVTIVDLTDPFLNAASASALFDIVLSLYLETEIPTGKLLVLDEAHKVRPFLFTAKNQYLTDDTAAPFVHSIFSVIRQQRHLGIRTVIATQEPTVIPQNMVGLCSTIICHRFSSPMWWNHLRQLIALDDNEGRFDGFAMISGLKTGEGAVFCPLALGMRDLEMGGKICKFGRGCLVVKVRRKLTARTGESVLSQRV